MNYNDHERKFSAYEPQQPLEPVPFRYILLAMLGVAMVLGLALTVMYLMK